MKNPYSVHGFFWTSRVLLSTWFHQDDSLRLSWVCGGSVGLKSCEVEIHFVDFLKSRQDWRTPEMIQISVALPNGHAELLSLPPSSTVQDLKAEAHRAFGRKHLRLITAKNRVLVDPDKTLEEAEVEDGECLTALVLQPQLAATNSAFALWCHGDSAVVTWGNPRSGGDSSAVQDQLKGVQQIQATTGAFAASGRWICRYLGSCRLGRW